MQWGIIGPGNIAREFAEDLKYVESENCEIGPVLGHRPEHTKEFVKNFGGYKIEDIQELLHAKPDAVYIATPHPLHYEEALACLQNKIPVLCEKPLAINYTQVSGLVQTSKENNTFFAGRFVDTISAQFSIFIQYHSIRYNWRYIECTC